ncbi:MAG: c-type cytochrome [Gammaproteobacteria bacterium]|nr:MAG: c-type cytochrome [Gammaproteobacteria bacterium]
MPRGAAWLLIALQTIGATAIAGASPLTRTSPLTREGALTRDGAKAAPYRWQLPRGFPTPAVPADNPMSEAKVALGQRLFFDSRLSVTGRSSCASCHDPDRSFSDGRPVAIGALGEALPHNALALVNVAYNISFGWTKRTVRSLEAQMLEPLLNQHPVEIGLAGREAALIAELSADPAYAAAFAAAYPGDAAPVSFEHIVKATASFERTLISGRSLFDRYVFDGEHEALSAEAKRGMALFFSSRVGCSGCHSGFDFAGNWRDSEGETGRASFARNGTSEAAVRVPTLRNIALTAPYMHDGRFATLEAVLDHYSGLAQRARASGGRHYDRRLPRSALTSAERAELVAFLSSLTDASFVKRFAGGPHTPAATPPEH